MNSQSITDNTFAAASEMYRRLRQNERPEADVSPLLAEKLPEFVFELGNKHVSWLLARLVASSPTPDKSLPVFARVTRCPRRESPL